MVNKVITRVALLGGEIKVYFGRTAQIGAVKEFIVKFANRIFYEGERHCANAKTRSIKVAIQEIVPELIVGSFISARQDTTPSPNIDLILLNVIRYPSTAIEYRVTEGDFVEKIYFEALPDKVSTLK